MGGPNLEVFKFGMYIFFPIGWMYYFGTNLDQRFAVPDFWPKKEETNTIPFERDEIAEELARLKARRLEARARRLAAQQSDDAEVAAAAIAAEEERAKKREGKSVYLRTLENTKNASVWRVSEDSRASERGQEEKADGKKGWFGLW